MMGLLLRLYINALMKGNPVVVALTMVGAVALSVGPFARGLAERDPAAIGMAAAVLAMIVVLLAVGVIDRGMNPERDKAGRPLGTLPSRMSRNFGSSTLWSPIQVLTKVGSIFPFGNSRFRRATEHRSAIPRISSFAVSGFGNALRKSAACSTTFRSNFVT